MKKIWASGVVKRVADGVSDKASSRCKKILPAGALLWAWEADAEYDEVAGEKWMVLHPSKYNKHVQYAWRFDPSELVGAEGVLGAPGQARGAPREPLVDECVTEDEFYE